MIRRVEEGCRTKSDHIARPIEVKLESKIETKIERREKNGR